MDDGGAVLDLNDFFYFVQVVDRGGFTAAARTQQETIQIVIASICNKFGAMPIGLGEDGLRFVLVRERRHAHSA